MSKKVLLLNDHPEVMGPYLKLIRTVAPCLFGVDLNQGRRILDSDSEIVLVLVDGYMSNQLYSDPPSLTASEEFARDVRTQHPHVEIWAHSAVHNPELMLTRQFHKACRVEQTWEKVKEFFSKLPAEVRPN